MDKITDFFKEFKSRLTNPLCVSFLISWVIINWRIPIGILGYNLKELEVDGYTSYADLIIKNASTWNYLWHPLIFALGYTFFFPVIRMFIIAFLSYIKKRSDNWNTEIMKDYYVPMSRFIKEKQKSDDLAETLNKIYIEDSKTVVENEDLRKQVFQLNEDLSAERNNAPMISQEIDRLKKEQERYNAFNDVSCIAGEWQLIKYNSYDDLSKKEVIKIAIHEYDVTIVTSLVGLPWGRILSFNYNSIHREITIVLECRDYQPSIDEHRLGESIIIDVHKVKLGYRGRTDVITDMEGTNLQGNKVQYSRPVLSQTLNNQAHRD